MALTEQQAHAARLLAAGDDQRTVGAKTGKHPSTISRWRQDSEFATAVERHRQELAKATPPPTTNDEVDTPKTTRATPRALGRFALARAIEAARQGGSAADWSRVAALAAKLLDDDEASSPDAMGQAINEDHEVAAKLVAALDDGAAGVVFEAIYARQLGVLGLDGDSQRACFQHTALRLPEEAAATWTSRWADVIALMRRDALRTDALARHSAVAAQHGDEPDHASIDHVHPVDATSILAAAEAEHQRLTTENTEDAQ